MAPFDGCSFKIVWIIIQVIKLSYAASIDYFPRLHPSENPDCPFRSTKDQLQDRQFKYQDNFSIGHEPTIEIRAILVPCEGSFGNTLDGRSRVNSNDTFYEDSDTSDRERIRNCHKKLMITLKLNNVGKIRTEDEYIIVSHVLDPITMQKSRLLNPYVIKIRREPVLQLYPLNFERVVNAEAREQIIVAKETNQTRCNDDIENPTCGLLFDNGVPVPFSQGFCCSCDTEKNTTRPTRESEKGAGNFFGRAKTIPEESPNKSSNRSKSRAAYDRLFDDSILSTVTRTDGIRTKRSHFTYNSRKLKENNINNNVSIINNNDIDHRQDMYGDNKKKFKGKSKNGNVEDISKYLDKNDDDVENATILFSSKIPTKGKIESYIDSIEEEASMESRKFKNNENTSSFDYKDFVIESPLSSKGSRYEKCKKRKKRYKDDRIENVDSGRKNLMDELTELEKAYDALKKMRRSKKGENRSTEKDESYERAYENLREKKLRDVDNIEKNAKETFSDKRKMKMDAKANENKMKKTRRCFRLRKKTKIRKGREKNEDREDSNSRKSMRTLTSRLDEFQARSDLGSEGKIYEDQSRDIEVPRKMEFAKYPLAKNASISGEKRIKKFSGRIVEDSREREMFEILTRLLVPDEAILRNLDILEVKRGTRNITKLRNNRSNEMDLVRGFPKRIKKSMKNGRKKLKRGEKQDFSSLSSSSGNSIENIETNSREKNGSRSIRVYMQRPDFDLVTDKYLNEPSMDFNSSDNPFLIDEDARRNGVDRSIEEKFGRISEVLKEASDEAKHFPASLSNETSKVIDTKTQRLRDEKIFDISKNKEKIISANDERIKNRNHIKDIKKSQKFHSPYYNKQVEKYSDSKTKEKRPNLKVPWNFDKTESNENAVDRIGHVEISSKKVPTTNFVEFKGGTRPLEKVIPRDKSSFSSNPVNGVERYTRKRPGESADRINVRASNDSKQISDLIISRSRLNSTIVVVDGSRPRENGVSYLDIENSGIVLRKINSSDDTKTKLLYKMKERWKTFGKERNISRNYSNLRVVNTNNKLADKETFGKERNLSRNYSNLRVVDTNNKLANKETFGKEEIFPSNYSNFGVVNTNKKLGNKKMFGKERNLLRNYSNLRIVNKNTKLVNDKTFGKEQNFPRNDSNFLIFNKNTKLANEKILGKGRIFPRNYSNLRIDNKNTKLVNDKTFGKERNLSRNYSSLRVFDKNTKLANDNNLKNKKNKIKERKITKPREIIFYEYNFEDDNDDDDRFHDYNRKSRTLLSLSLDDIENQDEDESDLQYEDYNYPKTDATKDKNEDDSMEDIFNINSMFPSKRKIDIDDSNYEDFNNNTSLNSLHKHNADKYIKQMSQVIAHRGKTHDTKFNEDENKKYNKIVSRGSKIVKKNVNDAPLYDFIPTQEAFDDAKRTNNFNQAKNVNFSPQNWNEKTNIDDSGIYDKQFDQDRERDEKSSFIDTSSYNTDDDKLRSSKLFNDKPMIEGSNEFLIDPRRKVDETAGNIDISVNGNIHVEGGIKGHPISIAFVAVPDTQSDSPMINNNSNFGIQKSDDSANGVIKLNEIVPAEPNDRIDTGSNIESMSNTFINDLNKRKKESNPLLINNNDDEQLLERNKTSFSSFEPQNHIYNDYKYGGIEKIREDRVTPVQRLFVFNSKLNGIDAKDFNSNDNSELVEEYEDDWEDDTNLKNLAREKKEAESFEYQMTEGLVNFMEKQSNDSLPTGDENVTIIKIIPEKLFDDVPSVMKNDFSNNFQINSYGNDLSSLEFPSSSNSTLSASDYRNAPSELSSYKSADSNTIMFPVIFETTVRPNDISQNWYKDSSSRETTTISKITEPDVFFRTMPTVRLSISDTQFPILTKTDNVNVTQTEKKYPEAEKSQLFNQTFSTTKTTNVIGDSCYKMRVTIKTLNLSETTTSVPATTISDVPKTPIKDFHRRNEHWVGNDSSRTQNSTIRERNASAVANFIKQLQAFVPNERKTQLNVREIIVLPEDTYVSNDRLNSKVNSNGASDDKDKTGLKSSLENSNPDKSIAIFLPSLNGALEKSAISTEDSTKENKLRKKKILESNSKLLSRTSKGSFYPSSWDSSKKEQQHQRSSSRSSTKRSFSVGNDGPDKSFLFYAQQKQPVGLPELLVKSQVGNDIDWDLRSPGKRVFLGRNKRNQKNEVDFRSLEKKMKDVDEVSLQRRSSIVKKRETEIKSPVDARKKNSVREVTRFPRFDKRKLEKRKKKMDVGEIKKLTGIRRRKKKKRKKMKKMGNRENTLDIPEVKTKWRLVKRNLLSVEATESGRLRRKLDKKRVDDGDLEITRKTYEESNASQVGRVSDGESRKKKKKKEEKVEDAGSTLIRRRQSRTDGKQVRGGQDCSNRDHPVDVDESKYLESAHCLRFSDLWYSVYRLDGPILDHGVSIQLYEKRSLPDGTARWENLTPSMIRLNTFSRRYRNNDDSLAFTYRAKREPSKQFPVSLDILEDRLLVPSTVSSGKSFKAAEFKGIFEEYLIVRASEISANGNECDKIGVGFKAFIDQPDRCGRLPGTCLKYQPLSYWKRDREAREAGRAGCYFLSNFASVPSEPIKYNVSGSGSGEFLALEYHSPHVSAIDIEVRNDYNGVASAGPFGRISHIYVDGTSPVHTLVTIVIRNVGSTPTVYRPRIVECPEGLPVSWSNAKGIVQMILPKQNRRVVFDLYGELPFNDFECTVELLDRRGKIVASRRMKIRRMDRCFCVWHCLCACVGGTDGTSCRPMSTEHYRAAGFQLPVPTTPTRSSSFLGSLFDFLLFLFSLVALLLTMGVLKWIIGIYVPAVGRWGLDTLLESTRMREYFEEELKCRCIVTDESGLPVHPDTGSRSIRICSRKLEFFLNVTFFLIYPITVCWYCTKVFFQRNRYGSSYTSNDESKACLTSDRDEYHNLVTVSTYGDDRNSKMEAEDTNYVMNELKKSQESLQEYNRYKRYRNYMKNQDTRY